MLVWNEREDERVNETKKLERSKLNGGEGKLCLLSRGGWNERDKVKVWAMETKMLERKRRERWDDSY